MNALPPPTQYLLTGTTASSLDPTLDSCCAREEESLSRKARCIDVVKKRDTIGRRERMQNEANATARGIGTNCGCCFNAAVDGGGGYPMLDELRRRRAEREFDKAGAAAGGLSASNDSDGGGGGDDDAVSSSDEFDYLLDELPPPLPSEAYSEEVDDYTPGSYSDYDVKAHLVSSESSRLDSMRRQASLMAVLMAHGYGQVSQLHPSSLPSLLPLSSPSVSSKQVALHPHDAKALLTGVTTVLHLFKSSSRACASLDLHLEVLAQRHLTSRWFRVDGEEAVRTATRTGGAAAGELARLIDALARGGGNKRGGGSGSGGGGEQCLVPGLFVLVDGDVRAACTGLGDFMSRASYGDGDDGDGNGDGDDGDFETDAVDRWLGAAGALGGGSEVSEEMALRVCRLNKAVGAAAKKKKKGKKKNSKKKGLHNKVLEEDGGLAGDSDDANSSSSDDEDDEDEETLYECGVPGCGKSFAHQHIGASEDGAGQTALLRDGIDAIHL